MMPDGQRPPATATFAIERWTGPVVIAGVAAAMLRWSWGTWPDVLVDFGRQLYIPWQLASGKTLYRDIAPHFVGPLSSYLNALWFRLCGVSVRTLVIANLLVLAGILWLLYRLLTEISDRYAATVACLVFVTLFAFGQLVGIGNYNFVCPYSHDLTYGVALSLASLYGLSRYLRHRRLVAMAASGSALGLTFLTKPEVFAAAAVALGVGVSVTLWAERPTSQQLRRVLGTFLGAAAAPPLLAFGLFCLAMPADQALHGLMNAWSAVLNTQLVFSPFYRWCAGTLHIGDNARKMLMWTGGYAALFVPVTVLALWLRRPGPQRRWLAALLFVILQGWLTSCWSGAAWGSVLRDALRPLPVILCVLSLAVAVSYVRHRDEQVVAVRRIRQLTLLLFALLLLGKIFLNTRVYHYGFALAMPATLLLVVALVGWLPAFVAERGGYGWCVRAAALAVVLVAISAQLQTVRFYFAQKIHRVGRGADAFRADQRGISIAQALAVIERRLGPDDTLLVLPEGLMLNYLARRRSPTPYVDFLPPHLIVLGEQSILASLAAHPPDYVALVSRDTAEFGYRYFGRDYGRRIYAWVQAHYREVALIGARPLQDSRFGISILQRLDGGGRRDRSRILSE